MYNGITADTPKNIQLGAGVICKNFDLTTKTATNPIGATRGGGTFTAVPTMRGIEVDGMPQNVVGMSVIDDWVVTLNANVLEVTKDNLKLALGAGTITSDKITARHNIITSDYQDLWWVGDTKDNGLIAINIKNALNNSGLNFTITDKGEGSIALTLVANYSITALDTPPFEIHRLDGTI